MSLQARFFTLTIGLWVGWQLLSPSLAEDWPTYMHDPARSGVSGETLALPLAELWNYVPPAEPTRAWPDPQGGLGELPKLAFDDATHVALAGDAVYFGSAVDNGVHALDAATGARRWTIFTEGPVRLAPTVAGGRVFAGSDDGAVYCVEAKDGRLVWNVRPMEGATRILGAGQVMSLWPVRTGVLVDGGVAYCGAGIFPSRGTAVIALDAASGKPVWKTSEVHKRVAYETLTPSGYLLASAEQIYVPCGRTSPLTYARTDGALRGAMDKSYAIVNGKGVASGGYGVLIDNRLYLGMQNVLHGYQPDGNHVDSWSDTRQLVATSNRYYRLTGPDPLRAGQGTPSYPNGVSAIDRVACDAVGRKRSIPKAMVQWSYARANLQTMIVAGSHVVVGGSNEVVALDAATGKEVWKGQVDGLAKGLAVANGRLVVSTDKGRIHCFGLGAPAAIVAKTAADPFPPDATTVRATALAEAIAQDAKIERGYGLVIGGDGARLAVELAKRTGLRVHVAETDSAKAAAAREALSVAGVYGTKVVVDVMPVGTNSLAYPPYFANVVVVDNAAAGKGGATAQEILRVLKPCGGVLYTGVKTPDPVWAKAGVVTETKLAGAGDWTKLVRGALPGARNWTHQYADAGNTGSSDDDRVRGKPEVLWYGEPGPDKMQDRHRGSEAPLSLDGRMFVQGIRELTKTPLLLSFDAYNGVPYWEREMPGADRIYITSDCGNMACSTEGLFVATGKQCQRLDLATGEIRATYAAPARADASTGIWAYVAVEGDTLVGSLSSGYQFSDAVFAYDLKTGQLKWRYTGAVIRNSTLAIQGGKMFFVEHRGQMKSPVVLTPLVAAQAAQAKRRGEAAAKAKAEEGEGPDGAVDPAPVPVKAVPEPYLRTVVALDLATGKPSWARDVNLAGCGGWAGSLGLIAKHDVLLMCGIYHIYGRSKGDEDNRRALALAAKDGAPLWDRAIGNRMRPVVVGDRIIGVPNAFDLRTGAPVMRTGPKGPIPWQTAGGGCGQMSASAGGLFCRDGVTVMRDAVTGGSLMSFSGMRPGCLINIIPAGGVIVQVEGSSGCVCSHALQATVVFVPPGAE